MTDIPEPGPEVTEIFKNLPITLHVGDPRKGDNMIIGWSNAWRNEDGSATIVMSIDEEASKGMGNLAEAFSLYSLGFAGKARSSE